MAEYDFSALTDKEFEELVRDLLSKDLGLKLRSFKKGKDKGIDIRYSSSTNINKVVVQAKHYVETGYGGLINNLKKEKDKVAMLGVERYLIATSVKLLPQYENEIIKVLDPYLKSANDIYSRERLSQLLSDNKEIEKKHFKLWLCSASIFQRIINNSQRGSAEFYEEKIRRNINKYVENESLKAAVKILKKHRVVLITGQPGVGKTTLSDMIIYSFLAKGFELVYAGKDIKEAENMVNIDPTSKQIFYLDDFLGATYLEILHPKSSDNAIVNFIERIQLSKNRYLILTTRTTILNAARQTYEKLNRTDLDVTRKELELKNYSDFDKAKILYSHIYHSKISKHYLDEVFLNKNYFSIIKHKNFNPRLIEDITDYKKFESSGQSSYFEFAVSTLNNPSEIWKHSFNNQITEDDRLLLFTLFTFGTEVSENVLEYAFDKRVEYEIKNSGFNRTTSIYNNALSRLLDGHLRRLKNFDNIMISFVNPSISDFLVHHLLQSRDDRKRILHSIVYIEQLEHFYTSVLKNSFKNIKNKAEFHDFQEWLKLVKLGSMIGYDKLKREMDVCKFLQVLSKIKELPELEYTVDELIYLNLSKFPFLLIDRNTQYFDLIMPVIEGIKKGGKTESFIRSNWEDIIRSLWNSVYIDYDIERIIQLFEDYGISYSEYLLISSNRELVNRVVFAIASDKISDEVGYQIDSIYSQSDLDNFGRSLELTWNEFYEKADLKPDKFDIKKYLGDIGEEDFEANSKNKDTDPINELEKLFTFKEPKMLNFDKEIEQLFDK